MVQHAELPDVGRVSHFEIDGQLPTPDEKGALAGDPVPPSDANRYLTQNHAAGGFDGFANPTALVGLVAVNGVATTAMRSDGAPALDQAIIPTWTGPHTFTDIIYIDSAGDALLYLDRGTTGDSAGILFVTAGAGIDWLFGTRVAGGVSSDLRLRNSGTGNFLLGVEAATDRLVMGMIVAAGAQLHLVQPSATGTIPALLLDQRDVSEQHVLCSIGGADVDFPAIIELDVTGTPAFWWDESADAFAFTNGLEVGDVVGGNFTHVESDGTVEFNGNATVWNDVYFPMSSGRIGGANQPTWAAFQGNTFEYTFAINDYIHLPAGEILHSYKEGSDIELHVHIVLDGSDAGDTDVNYEIEYTIGDINEAMSAAATETSGDQTIPGGTADRTHLRFDIGTITGTNLLTMAALKMRFRRIALVGAGNAPSNDPFVLMVGAHIEEDTVGSRTETTK